MKISCDVIRDLLPLYAEDMVSADSREMVEDHLRDCPSCEKALEELREPVIPVRTETVSGFKHFRMRMLQRLILGIMAGLFFAVTLLVWFGGSLGRAEILPVEEAVVSVTETDGVVTVLLSPTAASGMIWHSMTDEFTEERQHFLCCVKSVSDWLFPDDSYTEPVEWNPRGSTIWYYENGEYIRLYGTGELMPPDWGKDLILLPSLVLCVILALGAWLLKQKWMGYAAVLAGSYALADLVMTGGVWVYSTNSEGLFFIIASIMAVLMTCCIAIIWEFLKDEP